MKTSIEIVWCVDDIRSLGYQCTDEQGMDVLQQVKKYHDANYGITWDTIDITAQSFGLKLTKQIY